jgi:hypothetical protein
MNLRTTLGALALVIAASLPAFAQDRDTLIVTSSNTTANQLLVYAPSGKLLHSMPTGGAGGVGGNSGGIAIANGLLAVVNFQSQSVSIFKHTGDTFTIAQSFATVSSPVSVAFGHGHLYILGTTQVESHAIAAGWVNQSPDGSAALIKADGSAAQVGVLESQLVITEKSNAIETVNLAADSSISGIATLVQNIPSNVNAPFGLVTRGADAYVTIAHANEISLVRDDAGNDAVDTVTSSGTQSAPCWLALDGPFLYSSNSPSKTVSRYLVYGKQIIQQVAVAASFNGDPTDIAYSAGLVAVIDGAAPVSHLSVFNADGDGNLTLHAVATINSAANGVVIVRSDD